MVHSRSKCKDNLIISKEVLAGNWETGLERKRRLTSAGYDYNKVQAKVNQLLN